MIVITMMSDGAQWYWSTIATWTIVKADARLYENAKAARQTIRRLGMRGVKVVDA